MDSGLSIKFSFVSKEDKSWIYFDTNSELSMDAPLAVPNFSGILMVSSGWRPYTPSSQPGVSLPF